MYIRTREPHPWGATAATAPTTHARGHNAIAPPHQLPMPVPAVYARLCFPLFCFFFFFFPKKKKTKKKQVKNKKNKNKNKNKKRVKKKRKLGGEEEGHNHLWHTRTAHSTHTGEQEPSGPGHRTCNTTHRASTPVNRSQLAQDTADAPQQTARAHR